MSADRLAGLKRQRSRDAGSLTGPAALAEIDWLIREVKRLRGLLRRLEWADSCDGGIRDCGICPICGKHQRGGTHEPDCWLAAGLRPDVDERRDP